MKPFHFKQFSIQQDACAMKVSLDACLLGALCEVEHAKRILDIGTGTGLLALMAAQRSDAHIDAVELDAAAAKQAQENVADSPFLSQVTVHQHNIKNYNCDLAYDVILCNPPFFSDHLKGPNNQRNLARHNDGLSFRDLSECITRLLQPKGQAWLLLPVTEFAAFIKSAESAGLQLNSQWSIASRPQKEAHRVIFSLNHGEQHIHHTLNHSLMVHGETGAQYTDDFKSLLRDYYLKL